jgi:hypothetical protein
MMLLDTNVLIYASDRRSVHSRWARQIIAESVAGEGAAINAMTLAELCVGDAEPSTVADRVRAWGIEALDIPSAAAEISARAFVSYRNRRKRNSERDVPSVPLPDFFIGAHAQVMGWTFATADQDRYKTYFPKIRLSTPST